MFRQCCIRWYMGDAMLRCAPLLTHILKQVDQWPFRYGKLKFGEAILLHLGKEITHYFFDPNRIVIGMTLDFSPALTFGAGYLNGFQQQKSANKYFDRDILRFPLTTRSKQSEPYEVA